MSDLKLLNKGQVDTWRRPLMLKRYSFTYTKGHVDGATYSDGTPVAEMNVAVTCLETGESMKLLWG
jgi:hypothetical protein